MTMIKITNRREGHREKTGVLVLVLLLAAVLLPCSCMDQDDVRLSMQITMTAKESDLGKDPTPFTIHVDTMNTGTKPASDVRADILVRYRNATVMTKTVRLGDIRVGESVGKDEPVLVTFPEGHPPITEESLGLGLTNVYSNGFRQDKVTFT